MELYVKRIIRSKYAKPGNIGVLVAPLPEIALEEYILGESVLTQIIIDKYAEHLPLNRQNERFKRAGINIPSFTMSNEVLLKIIKVKFVVQFIRRRNRTKNYGG